MENSLTAFVAVLFFSVCIGYCLMTLFTGKFPVTGGLWRNSVLFGNGSVNPRLLTGGRARVFSVLVLILFVMFTLVLSGQNSFIINNILYSNLISVIPGLFIGSVLYKIALKSV